jgi:peroxiredoxin
LAVVQEKIKLFDRLNIKVVAASTDAEPGAVLMVKEQKITYPVGFGMTQTEIDILGAFDMERKGETVIQPAEFLLWPGGEIAASLYATTQLGRMNPREIAVFVKDRS